MTDTTTSLPTTYPSPVRLAIIGGTGISSLTTTGFKPLAILHPTTPWGAPSSPITILSTPHSVEPIAFLSRHGPHHNLLPSEVPNLANISALRSLGVRSIIAFSAVGSLKEDIRPRDFIVPDQVFDRTKGIRQATFFGSGVVGHIPFADPFDHGLSRVVSAVGKKVLQTRGADLHDSGTLICMEGPQFSTRAESIFYRACVPNAAVINMSCLPESKLAREAELAYVMICMATDYDCWKEDEVAVTVDMVMGNMKANGETAAVMASEVVKELVKEEHADLRHARHLEGSMRWGVCTKEEAIRNGGEGVERLRWLLPGIFGEEVQN